MKRLSALFLLLVLLSCAPVIRKDLMEQGTRNPDLASLVQNADANRDKLFVLGGIIARTTVTPEGSEIEALYVPVDSYGRTERASASSMRYMAIYPKERGVLDPLIYKRHRSMTIAGVFTGTTKGMLDKMAYVFPVFTIVQIHLQTEEQYAEHPDWALFGDMVGGPTRPPH